MESRTNSVLHSYYSSNFHFMSSKKFIANGLPTYINLRKENLDGLFVLQCQLTDKLFILGPALRESNHQDNMNSYIENLKESEDLKYINIIMRDFLDANKSSAIITLNNYKDNVRKEGYTFSL